MRYNKYVEDKVFDAINTEAMQQPKNLFDGDGQLAKHRRLSQYTTLPKREHVKFDAKRMILQVLFPNDSPLSKQHKALGTELFIYFDTEGASVEARTSAVRLAVYTKPQGFQRHHLELLAKSSFYSNQERSSFVSSYLSGKTLSNLSIPEALSSISHVQQTPYEKHITFAFSYPPPPNVYDYIVKPEIGHQYNSTFERIVLAIVREYLNVAAHRATRAIAFSELAKNKLVYKHMISDCIPYANATNRKRAFWLSAY